jgi:predicted amino acid-binding ACT domain protein
MDLSEALRIWRCRRWLTASLAAAALIGFLSALTGLPGTYQSQASVVLLASRSVAGQNGGNPYLSFSPSLTLAADAVSRALLAPAAGRQLASRGFTAPYTVAFPAYATATTGSVLLITVTGHDRATVQSTLRAVIAQTQVTLRQLQGRVRRRAEIRLVVLSSTLAPQLSVSQTARPIVVVALLGVLVAAAAPLLVDGWLTRRRAGMSHQGAGRSIDWARPEPAGE